MTEKRNENIDEQEPFLTSHEDLLVFLLGDAHKIRGIKDVFSFNNRLLSLSNLDAEDSVLYSLKLECAKEWFQMGFKKLAERRFSDVLTRFLAKRSVSGFERILQTSETKTIVNLKLKSGEEAKVLLEPEEEKEEGKNFWEKLKGGE
jgi:hypothetical protein